MPKYMIKASHTMEGIRGLLKEGGTSRRATFEQLVKGMGGRLRPFITPSARTT